MTLTLAPHPTARPQESCNMMVHGDLSGDWLRDYSLLLPEMLEDGVRVMIYAGDLDLICNWLGNARWVDGLEWAGAEQWAAAPEAEWSAGGGTAGGTVRSAAGLSFVKVYQAGHMVPMDQPQNALGMISAFTRGKELAGMSPADGGLSALLRAVDEQPSQQTAAGASGAAAAAARSVVQRGARGHAHSISMPRGLGEPTR